MVKSIYLKQLQERVNEIERIISNAIQKDSLSAIEHDLLLEKLRQIYNELLFGNSNELKGPQVNPKPTITKEVLKQPEVIIEDAPKIEVIVEDDPVMIMEEEVIQEEVEEETAEIHHDTSKEQEQSIPLGEKYKSKQKFRNEILGQNKKDFATVLQNKAIGDLPKAIGINDKFLFTKELFNGNAELYSKSIKQLNEFTDINDALIYIQENFSWDNDNEAASQLIDLIRRKLLHG